jgi:hypothetical protein
VAGVCDGRHLSDCFFIQFMKYDYSGVVDAESQDKPELFELGKRYAPLFAAFAALTLQEARRLNVPKVWFFTREGIFFKTVFEAYQESLTVQPVEARLLHVSRLATFSASLQPPVEASLLRLWSKYAEQTIQELAKSLGLLDEVILPHAQTQGLRGDSPAKGLNLQEPLLQEALKTGIQAKRREILEYLAAVGFPETDSALVVDIGWRGTIQDNLAHIRPDVNFHGLYLALFPRLNEQPQNVTKQALTADLEVENTAVARRRLAHVLPFEMLSNGAGGSVKGYSAGKPVLDVNQGEDAVYLKFTRHVQDGAVQEVRRLGAAVRNGTLKESELLEQASVVWDEIVDNPSPLFVDALLSLEHNETFGAGSFIKYGAGITWGLMLGSLWSGKARLRLQTESAGLPWKRQLRRHPGASRSLKAWLMVEPVAKKHQ